MKRYEVTREIYNRCAGMYFFDMNFEKEVCTDDIEKTLATWFARGLPEYEKSVFEDGSIEYIMNLPVKERYIFSEID